MSPERFDADAIEIPTLDEARRLELLSAYLDGELSPEAARDVTAWLDEHPASLREVEHLRRLWDLLDLYEDEAVPDDFATAVLDRTAAGHGAGPVAGRPFAGPLGIAAAAVLFLALAGGALLLARGRGAPVSETELAQVEPLHAETVTTERGAAVMEEVPPELLVNVDLLLSLSDDEFEGMLIANLDTP